MGSEHRDHFFEEKFSKSERKGISLLKDSDLLVYSVGISTGGIAEMKMAMELPGRIVIGTTIDGKGAAYAREIVEKYNFSPYVFVKFEDVAKPLNYLDNSFDFIYARLVLHYLSKQELDTALTELHRILKPEKKMFVVVRSQECEETKWKSSVYDPETHLTHVVYETKGRVSTTKRYFHSGESICKHLTKAGFEIDSVDSYNEQLFIDFERKIQAPKEDHLIEIIASKRK